MWEDVEFSIFHPWESAPRRDGFSLDVDLAKQVLHDLKGYRDRLHAMQYKVAKLCGMKPPSTDPSTMAMHVAMVGDGSGKLGAFSYGGGHIDLQLSYVTELIDRIEKALSAIGQADQDQAKAMRSTNPEVGSQGKI
ncbi:hypothetical protein [Amycolatopsis silviterrae]|uniref:Uncharacterized protein n=1 Tax=Amycolatopsis silviterrae TaxID=1656914 RepID=A0ABW5H359_9PSEU